MLCIDQLFDQAINLQDVLIKAWERITGPFLNVTFLSEYRKQGPSETQAKSQPAMRKFLTFCGTHGFHPPDGDIVTFVSFIASSASASDHRPLQDLQRFLEFVKETGFSRRELNNPFSDNLRSNFVEFMHCTNDTWPTAKALVKRLVSDVGARGEKDLKLVLNTTNWLDGIAAERGTDLVPLLEKSPLDEAQMRLGLLGKALLDANDGHLVDEAKRWWTKEKTEETITQRTYVLQIVMLLLPRCGADDSCLAPYRTLVLEAFRNGVESELEDVSDTIRHKYHSALREAASMFAQLDIANGAAPDIWIEAVRTK